MKKNDGQKPTNFKSTGKRMIKDFKHELPLICVIIFLSIASAVLAIFSPVLIRNLLNDSTLSSMFISSSPTEGYIALAINWSVFFEKFGTLLGLYVASALVGWLAEFLAVSVSGKYAYEMRDKIQQKVNKLPLSYFDRVPYGDTLSVATNDVDNISRNLQSIITQVFTSVTLFFGSIIAMLVTDWRMALVALCSLPFTVIIVLLIGKFSGKQFLKYRQELGDLNGKIEENYSGYKIIKLFNKEEDVEKDFAVKNEKMTKSDALSQFSSGLIFPVTNFINNLAYVAIAVVAGIIANAATMISFFLFLNQFTRPFQQIGQIFSVIQSVMASGERIYILLDEPETKKDPANAITDEKDIMGNFKFDHVYFQYLKDKPLIENFSLNVKQGDTVAIVGPTGAGKTTMVNLIMRFYEINNVKSLEEVASKEKVIIDNIASILKLNSPLKPIQFKEGTTLKDAINEASVSIQNYYEVATSKCDQNLLKDDRIQKTLSIIVNSIINNLNTGDIYLDGHSVSDYSVDTLRRSIGMVLQDTWLFKGTIRENLLYGDQDATDEEIKKACKEAHIDHFIETLPEGYNFVLNEDGSNISLGQRQLLTIARAIISKPKIMILDEATSSVDTRTEQQIQDALDKIMVNRTSFVIAHRLSTIKNAKMIIVMQKGHIVEIGNHKELLAKNGFYADLYNSQFSGINPMEKTQDQGILES